MIETGKAMGDEAAQILTVLPTAAQFPTTEYLKTLFVCTESIRYIVIIDTNYTVMI